MTDAESLENLPPLREVMERFDLLPRKALGQNFILDGNITAKIARAAGNNLSHMHVIEVGPGPGGLTRALLLAGAKQVVAVEKDTRCKAALAELEEAAAGRLSVVEADALMVDVTTLTPAPRMIVANLPYNIATPLLIGWLKQISENPVCLSRLTLMFQKEVADRIMASPGGREYGRLSVMAQWLCEVQHGFDLPPSVFVPPPKITSSVIQFTPREKPLVDVSWRVMEALVAKAFQQRRKMLRSSLKGLVVAPEELLGKAGIDPTARAEQLSVEQFGRLAQLLSEA